MKLEEIHGPRKILIVLDDPETQILDEATRATIGNFIARRDAPHFQGDEYHAHVDIPGGYQIAWSRSGVRRHESKFPATIPNDARQAVAKVLGIDPAILEGFKWLDDILNEEVYLVRIADAATVLCRT